MYYPLYDIVGECDLGLLSSEWMFRWELSTWVADAMSAVVAACCLQTLRQYPISVRIGRPHVLLTGVAAVVANSASVCY